MFASLFSGFQRGLDRSLSAGLTRATNAVSDRQRLLDQASDDRTRRRLATRAARRRRAEREQDDRLSTGRTQAAAAGSGLHLRASSKAHVLLGQTARKARATGQATSILDEALRDRLSRAALRRQRSAVGR